MDDQFRGSTGGSIVPGVFIGMTGQANLSLHRFSQALLKILDEVLSWDVTHVNMSLCICRLLDDMVFGD